MSNYTLSQLASIYCIYKDLSPLTHSVRCCTCGKNIIINSIEDCYNFWGHYIERSVEPKLKYHPLNSHAQCIMCNVQGKGMPIEYNKYMIYRYGDNIREQLLTSNKENEQYYINLYTTELIKLSTIFSELIDVVVQKQTGEILSSVKQENSIEEQFNTYSPTFREDLDLLCKNLGSDNFIEWEKL